MLQNSLRAWTFFATFFRRGLLLQCSLFRAGALLLPGAFFLLGAFAFLATTFVRFRGGAFVSFSGSSSSSIERFFAKRKLMLYYVLSSRANLVQPVRQSKG